MATGHRADVQITYRHPDRGRQARASGIRVRDDLVLTADHCAVGDSHHVRIEGGIELPAEVAWRSDSHLADLALLRVSGLPGTHVQPLAIFDRTSTDRFGCRSACYPAFKRPGTAGAVAGLAVPRGTITPAENTSPRLADTDPVPTLSFTLDPTSVLPAGPTVGPRNVQSWQSASGGGVLVRHGGSTYCVGVIVERDEREDVGSLHVAGFDTLLRLAPLDQERFWDLMNVPWAPGDAGAVLPKIETITVSEMAWALEKLKDLREYDGLIRDDSYSNLESQIVARAIGLDSARGVGA